MHNKLINLSFIIFIYCFGHRGSCTVTFLLNNIDIEGMVAKITEYSLLLLNNVRQIDIDDMTIDTTVQTRLQTTLNDTLFTDYVYR